MFWKYGQDMDIHLALKKSLITVCFFILHSPEISTLNCFLVQKLLTCIRTCNGLCLGEGVRRRIDCAYWVQLKSASHLWIIHVSITIIVLIVTTFGKLQGRKRNLFCLSLLALYYFKMGIVMWSFFIHYNRIHYEDDNLCCLKGKQSFRRITPLSFN